MKNLIRYLALIFPTPARFAYWSYKESFFARNLETIALSSEVDVSLKDQLIETARVMYRQHSSAIEDSAQELKEEIEFFEERLYLLLVIFLIMLMTLLVLKPQVIIWLPQIWGINLVFDAVIVLQILALAFFFEQIYRQIVRVEVYQFYLSEELKRLANGWRVVRITMRYSLLTEFNAVRTNLTRLRT